MTRNGSQSLDADRIGPIAIYFYDTMSTDWLINSAREPEHAPALEVFLDKESATDWSHFELELCLPVRKPAEMRS